MTLKDGILKRATAGYAAVPSNSADSPDCVVNLGHPAAPFTKPGAAAKASREAAKCSGSSCKSGSCKANTSFSRLLIKGNAVFFKAIPWILYAALVVSAWNFVTFVVPYSLSTDGLMIDNFSLVGIFIFFLSFMTVFSFHRSLFNEAGPIPKEWKEWNGVGKPVRTPRYALISSRFKEEMKQVEEYQNQKLVQQLHNTLEHGTSNIKTIKYSPLNADVLEVMEGVTIRKSGLPDDDNRKWKTLNLDEDCGNQVSVDGEQNKHAAEEPRTQSSFVIPPSLMGPLAQNIQWGNIVDPKMQEEVMKAVLSSGFKMHVFDQGTLEGEDDSGKEDIESQKPVSGVLKEKLKCTKDNCNNYRPPRSHHCSKCKTCVERMDHHCIWLNKCVGLGNHKAFMLFLIYFVVSSIIFDFASLIVFCNVGFAQDVFGAYVHMILFLVSFPVNYYLIKLLLRQLQNAFKNITEVENCFTPKNLLNKYRKETVSENLAVIFGDKPDFWWIPL